MAATVALALLAAIVAHVVLVASLARAKWSEAAMGLFVVPLAVYWSWRRGMRRRVYAWTLAVAVYALAVTIAGA